MPLALVKIAIWLVTLPAKEEGNPAEKLADPQRIPFGPAGAAPITRRRCDLKTHAAREGTFAGGHGQTAHTSLAERAQPPPMVPPMQSGLYHTDPLFNFPPHVPILEPENQLQSGHTPGSFVPHKDGVRRDRRERSASRDPAARRAREPGSGMPIGVRR